MRVSAAWQRHLAVPLGLLALGLLLIAFPARASSAQLIQGDADCSGTVAAPDATSILGQSAELGDVGCSASADTNCDHHIDASDALNVLLFLVDAPVQATGICVAVGEQLPGVIITVDTSVQPTHTDVKSLDGGPAPPVDVIVEEGGGHIEFVGNEVIYKPENDQGLQDFLDKYHGTVLRGGTTTLAPQSQATTAGGPAIAPAATQSINHGYFVVRVDPTMGDTSGLAGDLEAGGVSGTVAFSSEDAEKMMGIVAGDPDHMNLNQLVDLDTTHEQPISATSYVDADSFAYFTSGAGGLNIGVSAAWSYLRYQGVTTAEQAIPFQAVRVALIDTGFALDQTTGIPLNDNIDFFPPGGRPVQYDAVDEDYTAGETVKDGCTGFGCEYHGTSTFGVCCAIPDNYFGTAGSGGNYVVPILIRTDARVSTWADSIREAELLEADVISMSISTTCEHWCGWFDGDIGDATDDAGHHGRIQLAAAGNTGDDSPNPVDDGGDIHFRPCEFAKVICVGSIDFDKNNLRNWGSPVDIWAPEPLRSTVDPRSAAKDADSLGLNELPDFNGTSAATPFVAGIVALMKSLDPTLNYTAVREILQNTANTSPDPKVAHGYVNALGAVLAARENQPPVIHDVRVPRPKETYGYNGTDFRMDVTDPEPGALLPEFDGATIVRFTVNGQLVCISTILTYRDSLPGYDCTVSNAPIGIFNVVATVTDPFGAEDTYTIPEVHFVNTAPIVNIVTPTDGDTFYSTQTIDFTAYVFDAEEVYPFPESQVDWTSSIDGDLGNGTELHRTLTQGNHTVTITATDGKGVSTQQSITLHILSGVGVPVVDITAPDDGTFPPEPVTLTGHATDVEDGPLTGTSLAWYSDYDGFLGNGESITVTLSSPSVCATRNHLITLTATDSDGHSVSDHIHVITGCIG